MPINATGGSGELVTGVPGSDRDRDPFLNSGLLGRLGDPASPEQRGHLR